MQTVSLFPKSLFVLTMLASFFFVGCQNENLVEVTSPESALSFKNVYMMTGDQDKSSLEALGLDISDLQSDFPQSISPRSDNEHAHGHYSFQPSPSFYKTTTVTFSSTENSQGVNGTMHITRTWGENSDTTFQLILDAECMTVQGDEAIVAGILTQVTGTPPEDIFPVGARFWIKVTDNGKGPNAAPDEYEEAIIWNSSGTLPCEIFLHGGPGTVIWSFFSQDFAVLNQSDNIVVQ